MPPKPGPKTQAGKTTPTSTSSKSLAKRPRPSTQERNFGVVFNVNSIKRRLIRGRYAPKIAKAAGVYLAAVLEYLASELLELASNACQANDKSRITPRYLTLAIRNDDELDRLIGPNTTISQGGVIPLIHPQLLPRRKGGVATDGQ